MPTEHSPDYLDCLIGQKEAAELICHSGRALQNWRSRGGGPKFVRISGRSVRYTRRDLFEWIDKNRVANTTQPIT